jgi:hypothetical protein
MTWTKTITAWSVGWSSRSRSHNRSSALERDYWSDGREDEGPERADAPPAVGELVVAAVGQQPLEVFGFVLALGDPSGLAPEPPVPTAWGCRS